MDNVPGSNLLEEALEVINYSSVSWYRASGRTLNAVGQDVTTYEAPVVLRGSWQPVQRSAYREYGLDLQKTYFDFFVSADLVDIERDVSNDLLKYLNNWYQCESATPWFSIDGWVHMLCCLMPNAPTLEPPKLF